MTGEARDRTHDPWFMRRVALSLAHGGFSVVVVDCGTAAGVKFKKIMWKQSRIGMSLFTTVLQRKHSKTEAYNALI